MRQTLLTNAFLTQANLTEADLSGSDLSGADFSFANLTRSDIDGSVARGTIFTRAMMPHVSIRGAKFNGVTLEAANLQSAKLSRINLQGVEIGDAHFGETLFLDVDLANARGLKSCTHHGPSGVDFLTLKKSDPLPISFLRGIGLPDNVIDYLPSLVARPIEHYSCFISYSSVDQDFASRLHADLQNRGVRCWYAPHDMPIGGKILDEIDAAIRIS